MYNTNFLRQPRPMPHNNRLIGGGFAAPFLLGGITGGLLAPAFYPRPYYRPYPMYRPYRPYPMYY